ncbi:MAG: ATP-binding protein, partial [Deltaproteobacteria bacterium]|nr:ATP-binding protein [Deltaproteobacteria bacterium]
MTLKPIKIFNTAGPCNILEHYMLPVLPRLPDVSEMIEAKEYFILHAPRQSGKTTYLRFLTDK